MLRPTESSAIQTIHAMLVCFFSQFYQNVCLLLSLCMHISLIFHKVVQRRIYVVAGYVIITLLQIVCRVRKNFEKKWSIIGNNMDKSKVPHFWPTLMSSLAMDLAVYVKSSSSSSCENSETDLCFSLTHLLRSPQCMDGPMNHLFGKQK